MVHLTGKPADGKPKKAKAHKLTTKRNKGYAQIVTAAAHDRMKGASSNHRWGARLPAVLRKL
jgi:hypothetical protein